LQAPPRLELGHTVNISVEIEDNFGELIPTNFLSFIDLEIIASVKDILTVSAIHSVRCCNISNV